MTPEEAEISEMLGDAASKFARLPQEHSADIREFCQAIHAAQNIVMARSGLRAYRQLRGLRDDWKKPA